MSKKSMLNEEELRQMRKTIGEMDEKELQEIVGASGDVNAETTSIQCYKWSIQVTIGILTNKLVCK